VLWAYIKKILQELFYDSPTKIIVCKNREVTISEPSDSVQDTDRRLLSSGALDILEAISRIQREDCSLVRFPNVLEAEDSWIRACKYTY
jgi:hypothetical protein